MPGGYPWSQGDLLLANDLNAAIANAGSESGGAVNVLAYGADPTGVNDSSAAINAAAGQIAPNGRRKSVYLPAGSYQINHQIILTAGQGLFGDAPGNVLLNITDAFDPAASSVVHCAASAVDPGPCIRNVMFQFIQPSDQASRSNFKTLAAGGTSHTGGTGVQYPWCIDTAGQSRITLLNVSITGGWNGINANGSCFWIDGLRICALNIGISIGGTIAAPVADWAHLSDIEFYPFGLNTTASQGVYMDGTTIAMQIGAQNGLVAQNISCFYSRLVFTSDAASGWFSFTNLEMDADGATIEALSAVGWLKIVNLYSTAANAATRPAVTLGGGPVMITNWYSHWNSPTQTLQVNGGDVTVTGAYMARGDTTVWAVLAQNGTLRMEGCKIIATTNAAYTDALIAQSGSANLQLDNIDIGGVAGSSGTGVLITADNAGNSIGRLILGSGWTANIQPTFNVGSYGLLPLSGGTMNGGIDFGSTSAVSATDTSRHITLLHGSEGINTYAGQVNFVGTAWVYRTPANAQLGYLTNSGFVSMNSLGVWGAGGPGSKPVVTGAKGSNAALASLLTALAAYGLLTDSTT